MQVRYCKQIFLSYRDNYYVLNMIAYKEKGDIYLFRSFVYKGKSVEKY